MRGPLSRLDARLDRGLERKLRGMTPGARRRYLQELSFLSYAGGFLSFLLVGVYFTARVVGTYLAQRIDLTSSAVAALDHTTDAVRGSTDQVHAEIRELAAETSRAQRTAMWVAIGTGLGGALVGGVAGAFAAKILG